MLMIGHPIMRWLVHSYFQQKCFSGVGGEEGKSNRGLGQTASEAQASMFQFFSVATGIVGDWGEGMLIMIGKVGLLPMRVSDTGVAGSGGGGTVTDNKPHNPGQLVLGHMEDW